jgi:hypothetical protein
MELKKCACCGKKTLEAGISYDYCPVCGWQDDSIQNNDTAYVGGANFISLDQAKKAFAAGMDLRSYKKEARRRYREQQKRSPENIETNSLTAALI